MVSRRSCSAPLLCATWAVFGLRSLSKDSCNPHKIVGCPGKPPDLKGGFPLKLRGEKREPTNGSDVPGVWGRSQARQWVGVRKYAKPQERQTKPLQVPVPGPRKSVRGQGNRRGFSFALHPPLFRCCHSPAGGGASEHSHPLAVCGRSEGRLGAEVQPC